MGNLNMKYGMDRRATQGLVTKLLRERDQVLRSCAGSPASRPSTTMRRS